MTALARLIQRAACLDELSWVPAVDRRQHSRGCAMQFVCMSDERRAIRVDRSLDLYRRGNARNMGVFELMSIACDLPPLHDEQIRRLDQTNGGVAKLQPLLLRLRVMIDGALRSGLAADGFP